MRIPSVSVFLPCALVLAGCSGQRAEPARRDLTLLDPAAESATPAVVSAREMAVSRVEEGVTRPAAAPAPRPVPARSRARPAHPVASMDMPAPVPAAAPESAPARSEPEALDVATAGAGHALAPGQIVSVIPATSASGLAAVPSTDFSTERGIRSRPVIIIGDDRCIPGRGEVIPRGGPHGFRGRL